MPNIRKAQKEHIAGMQAQVEELEPLRAWKAYDLLGGRSTVWLSSQYITRASRIKKQASAKCHANSLYSSCCKEAPGEKCNCGFHGLKDPDTLKDDLIITEVEFYGKVIKHELGYRAEHQRIIAIYLNNTFCRTGFLCDNLVTLMSFPDKGRNNERKGLPSCDIHAHPKYRATPAQLSSRLGIEVRWRSSLLSC